MIRMSLPVRILIVCLVGIFDVYAIRLYYQQNDQLPFTLTPSLQREIARVLPPLTTPLPTPLPAIYNLEISESEWIGAIIYGKLTNHNPYPVSLPTLRFSLHNNQDDLDVLKTYTATIAASLEPNASIYFSQRFSKVPTTEFWWNVTVSDVVSASASGRLKPPSGQTINTRPIRPPVITTSTDTTPWGVAKQIDDVTWTIRVGQDEKMATPQETLAALNAYRQTHGVGSLTWDDRLASFAQTRAKYLDSIKSTDAHKGFKDYIASEDNVRSLGFWSLGENSGYGNKLIGVHLIEWIYASDEGHNKNQLDPHWSHVGIGIDGLGVAFIFGGDRI